MGTGTSPPWDLVCKTRAGAGTAASRDSGWSAGLRGLYPPPARLGGRQRQIGSSVTTASRPRESRQIRASKNSENAHRAFKRTEGTRFEDPKRQTPQRMNAEGGPALFGEEELRAPEGARHVAASAPHPPASPPPPPPPGARRLRRGGEGVPGRAGRLRLQSCLRAPGAGRAASRAQAAGSGRAGEAGACRCACPGRAHKGGPSPGVPQPARGARVSAAPGPGGEGPPATPPGLPAPRPLELPSISLFWWGKAGSSLLETTIFPGSLCLLIFQFLAAALSAGGAGGRGASSRLPERELLRTAGCRRPAWGGGPRGSPGASRTRPLHGGQELP